MATTDSSADARTTTDPATRAGDPFACAGGRPHGCYDGWVYMGFDGVEHDDAQIERVLCRRCRLDVAGDGDL